MTNGLLSDTIPTMSKTIAPELSKYFSDLGKKGGKKLLEQRGHEYYVKMAIEREARKKAKAEEVNGNGKTTN